MNGIIPVWGIYLCLFGFQVQERARLCNKTPEHTLKIADGMWLHRKFKAAMMKSIVQSELDRKRFVYSDIGFILLQQVVESITGQTLDAYLVAEFYRPMGLERTLFQPLNCYKKTEVMPTATNDYLRRQNLCGYVHDEAAAFMGGVVAMPDYFRQPANLERSIR